VFGVEARASKLWGRGAGRVFDATPSSAMVLAAKECWTFDALGNVFGA
jgi:hypothetical protein